MTKKLSVPQRFNFHWKSSSGEWKQYSRLFVWFLAHCLLTAPRTGWRNHCFYSSDEDLWWRSKSDGGRNIEVQKIFGHHRWIL